MQTMPATDPTRCQPAFSPCRPCTFAPAQQGIVLFIVMIVVLITSLLVIWASRSSFFNEIVTGNEADYQRAFEAAQAMLRDAELDIMETRTDGTAIARCGEPNALPSCRPKALPANFVSKGANEDKRAYFPSSYSLDDDDGGDLMVLEGLLADFKFSSKVRGNEVGCLAAICVGGITRIDDPAPADPEKPVLNPFWSNATLLDEMKKTAASYGQYTGAESGSSANPLLSDRAWYWVEPLVYQANLAHEAASRFAPRGGYIGNTPGIVYRITAYAEGRKPGTRVVLQSIHVRQEQKTAQ
ncbi:type IV pilus assembly protein PilX [Lampropedia hyalina DSM 16112]|jgi:type IV pilus assembly protein PilX|uniref:Type IV pilus assembly protein PilX n=1 Tax=Lampropedia hyalina DSM 16112 TaxID=1122156 RepID=A0A1M4YYP0_9BURK|nr:PilX N-terminal domain-containing pilus assembly protein [Lampropedia hyalina]SHF10934.1 type IV pilus assembly protein PilX [Lampropedia hyalina DSM 16112]